MLLLLFYHLPLRRERVARRVAMDTSHAHC